MKNTNEHIKFYKEETLSELLGEKEGAEFKEKFDKIAIHKNINKPIWIIAGPAGSGKSTLSAVKIAKHSQEDKNVLYVTPEFSPFKFTSRVIEVVEEMGVEVKDSKSTISILNTLSEELSAQKLYQQVKDEIENMKKDGIPVDLAIITLGGNVKDISHLEKIYDDFGAEVIFEIQAQRKS